MRRRRRNPRRRSRSKGIFDNKLLLIGGALAFYLYQKSQQTAAQNAAIANVRDAGLTTDTTVGGT